MIGNRIVQPITQKPNPGQMHQGMDQRVWAAPAGDLHHCTGPGQPAGTPVTDSRLRLSAQAICRRCWRPCVRGLGADAVGRIEKTKIEYEKGLAISAVCLGLTVAGPELSERWAAAEELPCLRLSAENGCEKEQLT
jgi:hypothetical protein